MGRPYNRDLAKQIKRMRMHFGSNKFRGTSELRSNSDGSEQKRVSHFANLANYGLFQIRISIPPGFHSYEID